MHNWSRPCVAAIALAVLASEEMGPAGGLRHVMADWDKVRVSVIYAVPQAAISYYNCCLQVIFLGMLWRATGNLAAPLTAALLANAVDFACVWRRMNSAKESQP